MRVEVKSDEDGGIVEPDYWRAELHPDRLGIRKSDVRAVGNGDKSIGRNPERGSVGQRNRLADKPPTKHGDFAPTYSAKYGQVPPMTR